MTKKKLNSVVRKTAAAGLVAIMAMSCAACGSQKQDQDVGIGDASSQESPAADESADDDSAVEESDAASTDGTWSMEGNFIDDSERHLVIYKTSVADGYEKDGWGVMAVFGEEMYNGFMDERDDSLTGTIAKYDDEGNPSDEMEVTLTAQDDQIIMKNADGDSYTFNQDDTDYAALAGETLPFFQYNDIYGENGFDPVDAAAYDYLAFEAQKDYDPAHVMIPYVNVVDVDETDASDVLIYGDYWLWEFEKQEDTLVAVSGGHRAGIIHAERFGEGEGAIYSAKSMEEALTDEDEKNLFGDHYDQYAVVSSDQDARDSKLAQIIKDYVTTNQLEVTKYQLSGEDVKELP